MPSQEEIDQQLRLLAAHRRTLSILLRQVAIHTEAHAPPAQLNGIIDARAAIAHLKAALRGWGVEVEDHPTDANAPDVLISDVRAQAANQLIVTSASLEQTQQHHDWDGAIDTDLFYGRDDEIAQLEEWIAASKCRVVILLGTGGIGKSALATRVARQLSDTFAYVLWRTLKNPIPIHEYLSGAIRFLSNQQYTELPDDFQMRLDIFINLLRDQRCLLVLDNMETLLREGDRAGRYRDEYKEYSHLVRRVGEIAHQSCLIITSREKSRELAELEGPRTPVRTLALHGLGLKEGRSILEDKGVYGTESSWADLVSRYSGNPLVLKLVAEPIRELFDGDIDVFLRDGAGLFEDTYSLLHQQFARLSDLESEIMYWLAIDRDQVTLDDLFKDIVRLSDLGRAIVYWLVVEREGVTIAELLRTLLLPVSKRELLEELASLHRRSMVETTQGRFLLQPVIMEYVTERFIDSVSDEITTGKITLFASHALIKAHTKDFIRESQNRLIVKPIIKKLLKTYRTNKAFERRLMEIIANLRLRAPLAPGYVGGNVLNLLCEIGSNLCGADFSHTVVAQAYLQNAILQDVNFAGADLGSSIFSETFGSVFSVAFSPDGHYLAAGSAYGEIRLWQVIDAPDSITLGEADLLWTTLNTLDDWVYSVAFHPSGRLIASANDNFTIKIWDVQSGECIRVLNEHTDRVWSIVFSPDGTLLASASDDRTVCMWDTDTGECLAVLAEHTGRVLTVRFSPDGTLLASAGSDQIIRLWDVALSTPLAVIEGPDCPVAALAFSPDGQLLASGGEDHLIKLWNVPQRTHHVTFVGHLDRVGTLAFSPDGKLLASGSDDQTIRLWNVTSETCQRIIQGHSGLIWSLAFNHDGSFLASGSEDQTLRLWEPSTGYCLRTLQGYTNQVWSAAFSPDGATVAAGYEDHTVKLWAIPGAKVIRILTGHTSRIRALAYSPDGTLLASGSEDRMIRLWNPRLGRSIRTLQGHMNLVWCVAFSTTGTLLASGSDDSTLRLWETRTGTTSRVISVPSVVFSVAFSPDDTLLATAHEDQHIRIWSIATGECVSTLTGHTNVVRSIAFSPDGQLLLSGSPDSTARIWDTKSGACMHVLLGHTSLVKTIAVSPDGRTMASGSDDLTVKIWDVNSGTCRFTLTGHTNFVKAVRFSPDGRTLISGAEDGLLKLWNVETGTLVQTLMSERPYERMNITDALGLTLAQRQTLRALGAIDEPVQD